MFTEDFYDTQDELDAYEMDHPTDTDVGVDTEAEDTQG